MMKHECHGHIILDGVNYKASMERNKNAVDEEFLRRNLQICKDHGITYYRDGGDNLMVSARAKEIAEEYGIEYRTPVYITHKRGHYGWMFGRAYDDMAGYLALVREAKTLGADFVKITVTGMMDFDGRGEVTGPRLSENEVRELVGIAEGEGLHVMAHVNGTDNVKAALSGGVMSIEHGFWTDESVVPYFLDTGAVWVPTDVAVKNLIGTGRFDDSVLSGIVNAQHKTLREAAVRGVYIASGSDSGAACVMQGQGTDDELAVLKSIGIDPARGNERIVNLFRAR